MKVFGGKKGNLQELVLGPLFPVLIAFVIFILMLNYTSSIAKSYYFEREFIARDVGLMVEAIRASPNDVQINYLEEANKKYSELNININKDYVETYGYNVDPKKSPSKTSRFWIFPSKLIVNDFNAAPRVEKAADGSDNIFSYNLYFIKTSLGITPSSDQKNIPQKPVETCAYINTFLDNWDAIKRVYVTTLYSGGERKTSDGYTGEMFAKSICTSITPYNGILSSQCTYSSAQVPTNAELVILIYVNQDQNTNPALNIYYLEGQDESATKSQKLECITASKLEPVYSGKVGTSQMSSELASKARSVAGTKPVIVIEVNRIEELGKGDDEKIGFAVYEAIKTYYTGK